jgi:hypothetical protein
LPDAHPADVEGLAQRGFGQLGARRQALVDDRLEDSIDDLFLAQLVVREPPVRRLLPRVFMMCPFSKLFSF